MLQLPAFDRTVVVKMLDTIAARVTYLQAVITSNITRAVITIASDNDTIMSLELSCRENGIWYFPRHVDVIVIMQDTSQELTTHAQTHTHKLLYELPASYNLKDYIAHVSTDGALVEGL